MPATKFSRIDINLIGEGDFSRTPIGRIVTWATTYGRYIMILTEIIVLLAFISRFSLDRKLTDLKEEITQKQAIIETNTFGSAKTHYHQNAYHQSGRAHYNATGYSKCASP